MPSALQPSGLYSGAFENSWFWITASAGASIGVADCRHFSRRVVHVAVSRLGWPIQSSSSGGRQ